MKYLFFSALLVGFTANSWAAGYQLRYQGAEAMGTSFASAGSYGKSLSSIYYNPALFLNQDKDNAVALELMMVHPTKAEFTHTGTGTDIDDFADTTLSGALYYGHKIDDDTAITVAVTTPWGTDTDYGSIWLGAAAAIKTQLKTINIQPMISHRFSDAWAFSVGPQIQYFDGTLSRAPAAPLVASVSTLNGDSISAGGVFALTYTPSERTTLGFNYTSQIKHSAKGDISVDTPIPPALVSVPNAGLEVTTPDVFTLGISHELTEKLVGHFSASYTNSSLLNEIPVTASGVAITAIPQNWDDTYMIALGATLNSSDTMTFRGGLSYETSAVENANRTFSTQDTDRVALGLGASLPVGAVKLDLAFNQIFYLGVIEIENPATLAGTYDMSVSLLRLGVEYNF